MDLKTRFKRFHFIRTSHFKNQFIGSSNSSDKLQLPTAIRTEQQNRTGNFGEPLRITQFELDGEFYTVGKLQMSYFKFHKWNSISTFIQRDMFN